MPQPQSKSKDRWTDDLLFEVAKLRYEKEPDRPDEEGPRPIPRPQSKSRPKGRTPIEIGALIGKSAATVRKMLKEAERRGIVQVLVVPRVRPDGLGTLSRRLREWFELKDVRLVPGREDLMADPPPPEKQPEREALVLAIARAAARYLEERLKDGDVLAVPWGRMTSYVSRLLQPRRSLAQLIVIPMVGVMGLEADPVAWSFEANAIAAQIAAAFGGRAWQLPAPAVADPQGYEELLRHPLVERALEKLRQATAAVVPIAPVDPENSTVVRMQLLERGQVERLQGRGAVGEIASHWWFDAEGKPLTDEGSRPIGLGLEGLRRMVHRGRRVIAVVGASEQRIEPLWVAIRKGLVNTLITDHLTAERLLELG